MNGEKKEKAGMQEIFPLQYGFRLENGDSWSLYFSHDLILWSKEFAQILGLKEDTQNHPKKIFFCTKEEACFEKYVNSDFLNQNTSNYDIPYISFPGMELRYYPSTGSYLFINTLAHHEKRPMHYIPMISALYPLYQETMSTGGMVLHAALLHHPDIGGVAILAPGGTGKSTCAERIPPPWSPYSDDLMLVVKDAQSMYYAHPLPTWSNFILGRSQAPIWMIEKYCELQGLFFLHKADHDKIMLLPQIDAVQWIYDSSMQVLQGFIDNVPKKEQLEHKRVIFSNACNLAQKCPSFILKAMYQGSFWVEIENVFHGNSRKIGSESEQP